MTLLAYTSYAEIRATLGVNDEELSDETLGLSMYASDLASELDDVSLQLRTKFKEAVDTAEASRTADQQRLIDITKLFATYTVAKLLTGSLPMFGPKSVGDSKTEVSRFNDSPYKETTKSIKSRWETYRSRVLSALALLTTTTAPSLQRTVMMVSSPSSDPVTG